MIKLLGKKIIDEESGIEAWISNKTISASGKSGRQFVFQDSNIEIVEKVANALLRFVEAAKKEQISNEYQQ